METRVVTAKSFNELFESFQLESLPFYKFLPEFFKLKAQINQMRWKWGKKKKLMRGLKDFGIFFAYNDTNIRGDSENLTR